MGVSIIHGAISSGKGKMCLDGIEKIHNENPSARCIMIVPDHYSYETEKRFVEKFGGTGLNNIEVLTLRRMAINTLTLSELNHLTEAGRQMLIYKAVTNAADELQSAEGMDMKLISSMRRAGFLDIAASLISEMKRYMVTPELLSEKAGAVTDNQTLKNKLTAFSCLFAKYTEYVEASGCADGEDDLRVLARHIEEENEYDENTYVWIDRFDKLMPQQLSVIEALLKKGVHMTISVCYPEGGSETEREIYAETEKTYDIVKRLAKIYGGEGEAEAGKGLLHLRLRPDLYTLLSKWNEEFEYDTPPQNMRVFQARDTYSEAERIACEITHLVREEGYRYRDIAMVCGDENEYIHLIEAIFSEYGIPYFTDRKIILSDHPIAMQILSLFQLLDENWSYDSVMSYLRAGFIYRKIGSGVFPLDQDELDGLENFILKCGIRGAKRWLSDEPWLRENDIIDAAFGSGDNDEDKTDKRLEKIDALRREIAAPVEKFQSAVKGGKSAKEIAVALLEYLDDINLYAGLKFEISRFKRNGMVNEAEQFTKIWNLILDVLNQTTTALPGDKLTLAEFADYMSVGLSKCEIRTIPSGIDQVYVGSAERLSSARVKVMFVAGAKNGTFPSGIKTEGFLSNRDRNTLAEDFGVTLAPDTKKKTDEQYFKVYRALCAVTDKLYLSYSIQDEEGKPLSPSHMLNDIMRKFPHMKISDNLTHKAEDDLRYISSPRATIHRMLLYLSSRNKERKNPLWDIVREWYGEREEWQHALSVMDSADYYDRRGVLLKEDIANLLYSGKISYSPTRLNTFAACPFEYFLKYGLGAKPREEWEITPMNMGTYAHRVIQDYCKAVEKDAETDTDKIQAWRTLSDADSDALIEEIIDDACTKIIKSSVRDKEKTESVFRRMGRTVKDAAALVHRSLSAGGFAENGMEREFEAELSDSVSIKGTIDRLDVCKTDDGRTFLRIIDYKTGKTEFDVVNIANGYNMQMVIYALAMREEMKRENAEVTGVYYTRVKDEYTALNTKTTEANIREKNRADMRLDGVTFADEDEKSRLKMVYSMDMGIIENGESDFIDVKRDDNGELLGVRSMDEINGLMEAVKETVIDMDERSRAGDISLNPYNSNGNGGVCAYCDYASVCKFDEKNKVLREKEGERDEIWDAMKTKGAVMRGVSDDAKVD